VVVILKPLKPKDIWTASSSSSAQKVCLLRTDSPIKFYFTGLIKGSKAYRIECDTIPVPSVGAARTAALSGSLFVKHEEAIAGSSNTQAESARR
jgi:hypothetical protein